jgi:ATP-dependent HslUV protease ATP-binding subunit HslU
MSSLPIEELTPAEIVAKLDEYIVGQSAAKRAVAVALRNRWRRQQVNEAQRNDIMPKNILMMGPTGVGKTEIARRLAQLARAPFVKVEATKFTEVGYVGRDVESMVRDLAANAVRLVETERMEHVREEAQRRTTEKLVELLAQETWEGPTPTYTSPFFAAEPVESEPEPETDWDAVEKQRDEHRQKTRARFEAGELEEHEVEIEIEESGSQFLQVFSNQGMEEMGLDNFPGMGSRRAYRKFKVSDARLILFEEEAKSLMDKGSVFKEAVLRAEQTGIIFIDEIDKVAIKTQGAGPDVSREGVQRDLLPIIEGSTVATKYGAVKSDHVLFIAAGAFHMSTPGDLIPELQGRLPIRVELEPLMEADFRRILKEPRNSLTRQYELLLEADGVTLTFEDSALDTLAHMCTQMNTKFGNIGARRLHTVMEKLLEDVLFEAPGGPKHFVVTSEIVKSKLESVMKGG